jgi:hypothetical protein
MGVFVGGREVAVGGGGVGSVPMNEQAVMRRREEMRMKRMDFRGYMTVSFGKVINGKPAQGESSAG